MNIGEEKEHIYAMMRDITTERRKLSEMYFSLKERLDELNKLEFRGLEDLSVKGYVDLLNQHSREVAVTNLERETSHVVKKLKEEPKEEKVISPKLLEEEKDRIPKKRTKYLNVDKVIGAISHVLKDRGVPMKMDEIYNEVVRELDTDIDVRNFRNNIMRKAMERNKKVQKAMWGYYQYNHNG